MQIYKLKLKNSAKEDSFFYIVQYLTNISWICQFLYTLFKIFEEKTSSGATTKPFGSMPR